MKFRILEKRGKFRIEVNTGTEHYTSTSVEERRTWFGAKCYDTKEKVFERKGYWRLMYDQCGLPKPNYASRRWAGLIESIPLGEIVEFDTYKQSEAYIKKHYGLEGVKAIEGPEWRVA